LETPLPTDIQLLLLCTEIPIPQDGAHPLSESVVHRQMSIAVRTRRWFETERQCKLCIDYRATTKPLAFRVLKDLKRRELLQWANLDAAESESGGSSAPCSRKKIFALSPDPSDAVAHDQLIPLFLLSSAQRAHQESRCLMPHTLVVDVYLDYRMTTSLIDLA